MKAWAGEFKRALLAVVLLTILLCGIYPLAVWGIGQLFFSGKSQRLPVKKGTGNHRISPDRPAIHFTGLFPFTPIGRRLRQFRSYFRGQQPGPFVKVAP